MPPRRGFTFVELLVVIGLIALLIGLLLPALAKARDQSKAAQCASQLHQLYLAQTFYSNDNRGHFTPVMFGLDEDKWQWLLMKYAGKDQQQLSRTLYLCPASDAEQVTRARITGYGVNSFVMLPSWQTRRDRKCNSSEIILMGEKTLQTDDYLTTDDGYFLMHRDGMDTDWWVRILGHRSRSSYRHARGTIANMVMLDGHVVPMTRHDLVLDSGHWYWGTIGLPYVEGTYCNCP